ncbi:MAG: hypothetical protein ABIA11_03110 [Patescibacteria group bacterium]
MAEENSINPKCPTCGSPTKDMGEKNVTNEKGKERVRRIYRCKNTKKCCIVVHVPELDVETREWKLPCPTEFYVAGKSKRRYKVQPPLAYFLAIAYGTNPQEIQQSWNSSKRSR